MGRAVCLTVTGDRPQMLDLSRRWFERSEKPCPTDWLVVDDGVVPYNPGGCRYVRREPDGSNSLGRQLKFGLELCREYDHILIWEDDDWYSPKRIKVQIASLIQTNKQFHGWGKARYYHLGARGVMYFGNCKHSSLHEVGFTSVFIDKFLDCIRSNGSNPYYDLCLFRRFGNLSFLTFEPHEALGIKGGPGRGGYSQEHQARQGRYKPQALRELIGADADFYAGLMK